MLRKRHGNLSCAYSKSFKDRLKLCLVEPRLVVYSASTTTLPSSTPTVSHRRETKNYKSRTPVSRMAHYHRNRAHEHQHSYTQTHTYTHKFTHLLAARERRLEVVGVQVLPGGDVLQPHHAAARHRLSDLARQGPVALLHLELF